MSEKSDSENKKENDDKPTLASFIDENHKLITTLGVFTALTIFSLNLEVLSIGRFLSMIFLTLVVLVWIELIGKFPSKSGNWTLNMFENLVSIAVLIFLLYWFYVISEFGLLLTLVIFLIIASIYSWLFRRFDLFNRLFKTRAGEKKRLRYILMSVILIVAIFIALYIANFISIPIKDFIDESRNFSTITPTP